MAAENGIKALRLEMYINDNPKATVLESVAKLLDLEIDTVIVGQGYE